MTGEATNPPGEDRRIPHGEPDGQLLQALQGDRIEMTDGTVVDQPQVTLCVDEDIPRMRISVVNAVGQDLREERVDQLRGELLTRHPGGIDGCTVGDRDSVDGFHDEHPGSGVVGEDLGHLYTRVLTVLGAHGGVIGQFASEVKLLLDAGDEFPRKTGETETFSGFGSALQLLRGPDEHASVAVDVHLDPRSLHLDDDTATIEQCRAVRDTDRGCRERVVIEPREHL